MSTIKNIEELREKRAKLFTEMGEVLERSDADGTMSAEDAAEYDRREQEFDKLTEQVERVERYRGIAPKLNVREVTEEEARDIEYTLDVRKSEREEGIESRQYEVAFEQYCRFGMTGVEQRAALQVGTASEGGYTVAQECERQLIEALREYGVMFQLGTTFRTGESGQVHVPTVATRATAALTAEEAAFTESEDTFGEVLFDSYKIGVIMKISDELLNDSIFDLAAFMARSSGQAIAVRANNYFVIGTGSGQPNGITVAATVGKTAAAAAAITSDELIDLYHSVLSPYRARSSWIMRDATIAAVRKLKETTNQYLWQPGLQAGATDLLLGRPVYSDPDVPALATTAKTVVFGDISAYWIREVGSTTVKRLEELYAANGQVGFRVDRRLDGDLVDTAAVKTLQQA